ncbi:MAG TPA: glycosyltransferase [Thermoanaerobaculia bacterium]|nr:glycosyltransferase [Thermoanaerobaculia bacterium]
MTPAEAPRSDPAEEQYRRERIAHWDGVASRWGRRAGLAGAYHRRLERIYRYLVPPGLKVLELGCGTGDLLAALQPAVGVGIDFSGEMVARAADRYPGLRFLEADAHCISGRGGLGETFDVVILSDLINDAWDVQKLLSQIAPLTTRRTRVIVNFYSRLWELPLAIGQRLGLARPILFQNWLTVPDVKNLLRLAGFDTIRQWQEILLPISLPGIAPLCNRFLVRFWPFRHLALSNFLVARPKPSPLPEEPVVSVVVPARNEEGNIPNIFARTPEMGAGTELIFVEGHSQDGTWAAIEREIAAHPERRARAFRQTGKGKGDAVRLGFAQASGDVLMILDADLTVPPEDLPRFYEVLRSGAGEFVNGVRLVYPMEKEAMRFANLLGNKFFSLAFSWLLGQPVKDTLCGTKVLRRPDYEALAANRSYFGDFDPFGDYDLLFGAAKLGLEIVEVPVRYRERTYGTTNIQRWIHGWLLLKMCAFAAGRIKFI